MQRETVNNNHPHVPLPIFVLLEKTSKYFVDFCDEKLLSKSKISRKPQRLINSHEDDYCSPFRAAYGNVLYNKNLVKIKLMCFRLALFDEPPLGLAKLAILKNGSMKV